MRRIGIVLGHRLRPWAHAADRDRPRTPAARSTPASWATPAAGRTPPPPARWPSTGPRRARRSRAWATTAHWACPHLEHDVGGSVTW